MNVDKNRQTLNDFLNLRYNPDAEVYVHDSTEWDLGLMIDDTDDERSAWLVWNDNRCIYVDHIP